MKINASNRDFGSSQVLSLTMDNPEGSRMGRITFSRKWVWIWRYGKKLPEKLTYAEFIKRVSKRPLH